MELIHACHQEPALNCLPAHSLQLSKLSVKHPQNWGLAAAGESGWAVPGCRWQQGGIVRQGCLKLLSQFNFHGGARGFSGLCKLFHASIFAFRNLCHDPKPDCALRDTTHSGLLHFRHRKILQNFVLKRKLIIKTHHSLGAALHWREIFNTGWNLLSFRSWFCLPQSVLKYSLNTAELFCIMQRNFILNVVCMCSAYEYFIFLMLRHCK